VHKYTFGYETYVDGTFTILMEQRKKGRDDPVNIPAGARVRIVHVTNRFLPTPSLMHSLFLCLPSSIGSLLKYNPNTIHSFLIAAPHQICHIK
jgi:hypothetical protein